MEIPQNDALVERGLTPCSTRFRPFSRKTHIRSKFLKFEENRTKKLALQPTTTNWRREARRLLQVELARKDIGYKELSRALESVGVDETAKALSNKINRGTFSFSFFLQCMAALKVDSISFRD
ncbi:MAG: hypothetical protein JWR21_2381 [Herminiimonas sp.]|nr:hypothetical protein [Herminiimonas sp.]